MSFSRAQRLKPDGRTLWLYARGADVQFPEGPAPVPAGPPPDPGAHSHLRFHPLRGEWVAYAPNRQHRTFLPPPEWNPLAPERDAAHPTEVPEGPWEVAVFENRFPTLRAGGGLPPRELVPTAPGAGACEVVVFTQDPRGSLSGLPLSHLALVLQAWADRTQALGAREDVAYVFAFENRGVEVGVTINHPHGQLYAYPFVPPIPQRELSHARAHLEAHGVGVLEELLQRELDDGRRVLYASPLAMALVPVCARNAYEVWVAPRRRVAFLGELSPSELLDFARALQTALRKLDGLWNRPMPYVLSVYQAPTDGAPHPEAHLRIEIAPAYRMEGRLKYLAGSELGAGVFTADTLPEDKAAELQAVEVQVD